MTEKKRFKLKRRLQESRYRLLTRAPEFAYPLMDMLFVATKDVYHMSTNGHCIYLDDAWLEKLQDWSLDYALCHQLMHLKLGHLNRSRLYRGERYHYACNVIVNAHLIDLGFVEDYLPGIGELHCETMYPTVSGLFLDPMEAYHMCPIDPAKLPRSRQARFRIDTDTWWDRAQDRGETGTILLCPADEDPEDLQPGEKIRGVIEKLPTKPYTPPKTKPHFEEQTEEQNDIENLNFEFTTPRIVELKEAIQDLRQSKRKDEASYDDSLTERVLHRVPVIPKDWRTVLNHFVLDDTKDYDFTPPDRRMQELEFFLPDFNEASTPRMNVLFMVDISGSLQDDEVSMAIEELEAAMEQFGGMLQGTIGFFDKQVRKVVPISRVKDLPSLVPGNGGGTDFGCIFHFVREIPAQDRPSEIVIMTDGQAEIPPYEESMGIPVLWLLTNFHTTCPWGRTAYFRTPIGLETE